MGKFIIAILKIIKNYNNSSFLDSIINLNRSPFILKIESYGNENKGDIIYSIKFENSISGFFSDYRKLLEHLYFADRFDLIPIISSNDGSFYSFSSDEVQVHYLYYFYDKISYLEEGNIYRSMNVISSTDAHRKISHPMLDYWGYDITQDYIDIMTVISKKYLKYNFETIRRLEVDVNKLLGNNKTLGVHIRGTDFNQKYDKHPKIVDISQFIQEIDFAIEKYKYSFIFLATDDLNILNLLIKKYQNRIIYYLDNFRSQNNTSVTFIDHGRIDHNYLLGYEVLRDMYTLTKCSALIGGLSSVTTCARIEKQKLNEKYEYLKILSNGIYKNNKSPDFLLNILKKVMLFKRKVT